MTGATPPIPVTIITGFLGSGKTTLLLSLLPQLPGSYNLCLLKNEFGDVEIDSRLASQASISGVTELLNGCICCNLVGQLGDALIALRDDFKPHRIVIETSGSAFPATLAMEVNRIASETNGAFVLDGVVVVIDVENWAGYYDTSYTAKLQARYTDLIVLNKWENVDSRREDVVMDRIRDVNEETPVVKSDKGRVSKDVIFGVDSSLANELLLHPNGNDHDHDDHNDKHSREVEVLSITLPYQIDGAGKYLDVAQLETFLKTAPKDEVYRIKGTFRSHEPPPFETPLSPSPRYILNWAFGRWTYTALKKSTVSTTIEAPQLTRPSSSSASNSSTAPPSPTTSDGNRRIEVIVQTSIKTTVESREDGEDARWDGEPTGRFIVVAGRGEGERWKKRLQKENWITYDNGAEGAVEIVTVL
ncbi:uncharacterized protein H6S33_005253 [Morchella sextelata]|uniref:uncharacterized protein n=1 Tax=Morchella sextelata TaxID=1174677 RepID=UPI001D0583BB|nr:uncharacterized protein H6S33_005253 [Morchella sextelata]KAH0605271.1 hypothetical protein H6S33_005253 [Morchella sextelata]